MENAPEIKIITYEEYKHDKDTMTHSDKTLFESNVYKNPLEWNDTEQLIASLKGLFPANHDFNLERYNDIAHNRSATSMAYDLHSK